MTHQPQQQRSIMVTPQQQTLKTVQGLFTQNRKAIEDALPRHVTADRMIRIALTELRKTTKLLQCDPLSILGSIVQASQLGLEPGGALGHCYLVPYKRECQLQIGYRGMVDLARRSGNIVSLSARCIFEGDVWGVEFGTEEKLKHVPSFTSKKITHVYAVAQLRDGGTQFEIMSLAEVEHIRDTYSSSYRYDKASSPWSTNFEEMAKKTLVRRLFKMLPTSVEIRQAIAIDDDDDQHNAKVISPDYEVLPLAPDEERILASQRDAGEPLNVGPAADADRKVAIDEFTKALGAANERGVDSSKVLGCPAAEILKRDAKQIQVATDLLERA